MIYVILFIAIFILMVVFSYSVTILKTLGTAIDSVNDLNENLIALRMMYSGNTTHIVVVDE
jgi:amino acid permease